MGGVLIETPRFLLRSLVEADATERYLSWLNDAETARTIAFAAQRRTVDDLRAFITERRDRQDVLFLGIFDRNSGAHIGNIKYEPVDHRGGRAVMGILVGEPAWRGKGVAGEVLRGSAFWLRDNFGVTRIVLGVAYENEAAIAAYRKTGFLPEKDELIQAPGVLTMVWRLA